VTNPTAESERLKYERIYQFPAYGQKGHGTRWCEEFKKRAVVRGALVGDFGCGRGASFPPYVAAGYKIQPIDFVDALLPEFSKLPGVRALHKACLWGAPLPPVEYGICTDVAEHIPTAFVPDVLDNIAAAVQHGCLWTVCHVNDGWGQRIGQRLHMTVQLEPWWTAQLKDFWWKVEIVHKQPGNTVYWTEHLVR